MSAYEDLAIDPQPLTVALVNNMPDAAFVDTEGQFRRVVAADPRGSPVELQLYTIAELRRSEAITTLIRSQYHGLDDLWANPPDALIVTGTEPAQAQLPYEPYWPYLARLLEWAAGTVPITLLSCLASHASILLFDKIERVPRPSKLSGVFAAAVEDPAEPLAAGLPERVPVPHSRVNDIPTAAIIEAGYRVVLGSGPDRAGWSVATKNYGKRMFVLCQGHPEYSTLSLLREYRRDVRRSLFGRGAVPYPRLPDAYVSPEGEAVAERFAQRAATWEGEPVELWASFPFEEIANWVDNTWVGASQTLYANWLRMARAAEPAPGPARA